MAEVEELIRSREELLFHAWMYKRGSFLILGAMGGRVWDTKRPNRLERELLESGRAEDNTSHNTRLPFFAVCLQTQTCTPTMP